MTQGTGSPYIWPRRLGLPGTLCPSALEMACLGLPRAGLSQPCLENAFYLREACCLIRSLRAWFMGLVQRARGIALACANKSTHLDIV